MDPEANLREQKMLAQRLLKERARGGLSSFDDVARLAELVLAMDEWLSSGGFPPKAWKKP